MGTKHLTEAVDPADSGAAAADDSAGAATDGVAVGEVAASELATEHLEARICQRAANMTAAEALWLLDIAEFDRREGWAGWGIHSCAAWLSWQVGLERRAARDKVRVAHTLVRYPVLAAAMSTGALSYSKARALARIVNDLNVAELLAFALACTSNQLERYVSAYRRSTPPRPQPDTRDDNGGGGGGDGEPLDEHAEDRAAHHARGVWVERRRGLTEITIRLPTEPADALLAAIELFTSTESDSTLIQRRADALVELAEHAVAHADQPAPATGPRYLVTVHLGPDAFHPNPHPDTSDTSDTSDGPAAATDTTTAAATPSADAADDATDATGEGPTGDRGGVSGSVADGSAGAAFGAASGVEADDPLRAAWDRHRQMMCCATPGDDGPAHAHAISTATARRLLCDAALEGIIYGPDGNPNALGNQTRRPNRRTRRALQHRDGHCRFPDCTHRGWLDAHHIIHWLDHGKTLIPNLVLLCRRHHRLVHEDGWQLTGNPGTELTFTRPDGRPLPATPPIPTGDPTAIDQHARTADDGRCQWLGDPLQLDYAISVMLDHENFKRRHDTQP